MSGDNSANLRPSQWHNKKIQEENWKGLIPIQLSLHPSSLSSPSMPPPLFKLVSRQSFLHIALKDEIQRLYAFAPSVANYFAIVEEQAQEVVSSIHPPNAVDSTAMDITATSTSSIAETHSDSSSVETHEVETDTKLSTTPTRDSIDLKPRIIPICWFIDQETQTPLRWHLFIGVLFDHMVTHHLKSCSTPLPWKIQISFTSYPTQILLPLPDSPLSSDSILNCSVTKAVSQIYTNSLKQALFLQYNSSRMALTGMTKQMHQQLWSSILRNKFELYRPIQEQLLNTQAWNNVDSTVSFRIPIGILMDSNPMRVRPCSPFTGKESFLVSLGDYLQQNLPEHYFQKESTKDHDNIIQNHRVPLFTWMIQGIRGISLTLPLVDIWMALCHPDHFLYIIVSFNDD